MRGRSFPSTAPAASSSTERLLDEWAVWMRAGAMSHRTIADRVALVRRLEAWTGGAAAATTWQQLAALFAGMIDTVSPGTRSTYYQNLRQWFRWLVIFEHRVDDPTLRLHPPKVPRRKPRPITSDQLRQILGSDRFYGRARTMILLAAYEGLRVHEIAKICGEDFTPAGLFVRGKGGVEAVLPVHPIIERERASYPARGWWFPSYELPDSPMLPKSVSTAVSRAMHRAGVDATAHQLRHYFGTQVHRAAGGDLRVAQELLRHASPATTALYTEVDDSRLRLAMAAL